MKATGPQTPQMVFKEVLILFTLGLSVFLAFPSYALAADETACSRGDIIACYGFESLSNCTTGREETCWSDNGALDPYLADAPGFYIRNDANIAAVGSGYIQGVSTWGTTGPGYVSIPFDDHQTEVGYRFYVKFDPGYTGYPIGPHGPGIFGHGDAGCVVGGTFDLNAYNYLVYASSTCHPVPDDNSYPITESEAPILQNGKWYRIEMYRKIDTSCTDNSVWNGCNGILKVWVDGTLSLNYTNLNWGGVTNNAYFDSAFLFRHYYHANLPEWEPDIYFDNFVLVSSATTIGAASNENSLGTVITGSPYLNYLGIEPFYGKKPASDCSTPTGKLNTNFGQWWRDDSTHATRSTDVNHAGFLSSCSPTGTDSAMKIALPGGGSAGAGLFFERWGGARLWKYTFPTQAIYGYIYIPSGQDLSTKPPLTGFPRYHGVSAFGDYVALTVNGTKWAIVQKDAEQNGGTPVVLASSSGDVTYDAWHQFELMIYNGTTDYTSLMIDGVKVIANTNLSWNADWLFDEGTFATNSPGQNGLVVGVIDYTDDEALTVYYDDLRVGSASHWSCDGWGDDCPFGLTSPASHNRGRKLWKR